MKIGTPKQYEWLREGTLVDYHGVIGGPVTAAGLRVREEPFQIPTPRGQRGKTWCVMLTGKSGWVVCEALSRPASSEHGGGDRCEACQGSGNGQGGLDGDVLIDCPRCIGTGRKP